MQDVYVQEETFAEEEPEYIELKETEEEEAEYTELKETGEENPEYVEVKEGLPAELPDQPFIKLASGAYACNICCRQFASHQIVNRHLITHTGLKPFRCFKCEVACTQKVSLRRHCLKVHGISKEHFVALFNAREEQQ